MQLPSRCPAFLNTYSSRSPRALAIAVNQNTHLQNRRVEPGGLARGNFLSSQKTRQTPRPAASLASQDGSFEAGYTPPEELRLSFAQQHCATQYTMKPTQDQVGTVGGLQLGNSKYFKHNPLSYSNGSIRLVQILPSLSAEQIVQCEISHTTTDASYECLSYRWGELNPEHDILLNGKLFKVRQNLFEFLEHMRLGSPTSSNSNQLIWIDALCIDQSSINERNHQVAQMGAIFRSATLVKIWLGKCVRLSQMLLHKDPRKFLRRGNKLPTHINLTQTNEEISPLLANIYRTYGHKSFVYWERDDSDLHKQLALHQQVLEEEFFNNEYWTRAWITQEIYVAKSTVVMLENDEFSIAACMDVLWGCNKFKVHSSPAIKKFALLLGFDNSGLPLIQPGGTSKSFLSLLRQFSDKKCTIPRDRLYSLLSLYCNGDKVAIDYAQPDDELLCHIVECLHEPVGLCSIISLTRSLMPQSEPLGAGLIEIDRLHLVLEWGPAETPTHGTVSQVQPQHTYRQLVNIQSSETPCVFLHKVLEHLHGKATLIESRSAAVEEPDFAFYGQQIITFPTSENGAQVTDIIAPRGKIVGPNTLRMYAHDFSIGKANKEGTLWTLRIRLSLLWTMFGTANPVELCDNMHRFSYGGICQTVRLGLE
jgi:hypothetical protein